LAHHGSLQTATGSWSQWARPPLAQQSGEVGRVHCPIEIEIGWTIGVGSPPTQQQRKISRVNHGAAIEVSFAEVQIGAIEHGIANIRRAGIAVVAKT
jgi:hypothetical protein